MKKHFASPLHHEYNFHVEESLGEDETTIRLAREGGDELSFYLEENILGVLIPAFQSLLKEYSTADPKSEEEQEYEKLKSTIYSKIDPINWIAMYLIRNNPKHSKNLENNPYSKLLKEHIEKIRPEIMKNREGKSESQIKQEIKDMAKEKLPKLLEQ